MNYRVFFTASVIVYNLVYFSYTQYIATHSMTTTSDITILVGYYRATDGERVY